MRTFSNMTGKFLSGYIILILFIVSKLNAQQIEDVIQRYSIEFETPDDFDDLIEQAGDRTLVLMGEASHGTSEFYTWRTELSKRLIMEKRFNFIAFEGDWPCRTSTNLKT